MEFGAHLPLVSFSGESRGLADLVRFTRTARDLGDEVAQLERFAAEVVPLGEGS